MNAMMLKKTKNYDAFQRVCGWCEQTSKRFPPSSESWVKARGTPRTAYTRGRGTGNVGGNADYTPSHGICYGTDFFRVGEVSESTKCEPARGRKKGKVSKNIN